MGVGKDSQTSGKRRRRISIRRRLRVERLAERRVLATVTGMVFNDADLSFRQDADEVGLGNRLAYLDLNVNGTFETGEPYAFGQEDGSFEFANVADGSYQLRLYNGTDSQQQSFPVQADRNGLVAPVTDALSLAAAFDPAIALTNGTIELANFADGETQSISVGADLTGIQSLPDGKLIITGGPDDDSTAWLVDPSTQTVTPIDLSGDGSTVLWSQVAIDGDGYGVALEQSDGEIIIRSIDASDSASGISAEYSYQEVPADTQVITSATGGRSILGWANSEGLQVTTWSNSTATWINETPISIPDSRSLLAFDDASGLLVLRSDNGGVTVHDADANFANLGTLPDVTGPVALDGQRDLLLALTESSTVQLYDVRDGELIADLAVDLENVGAVSDIQYDGSQRSLVVLGARGMAEYSFNTAAHHITITDNVDPDPVSFGLTVEGDNAAPHYLTKPSLQTDEDTQLQSENPGILSSATDEDNDSFVVVLAAPPRNGTAIIQTAGGIRYQPNRDFFGTDTFTVVMHDGRDSSGAVPLQVQVNPTPDAPTGIIVDINPIPELAALGFALGPIDIIDVDLNDNHIIQVGDDRFVIHNGQLIFVQGELNFELQPSIDTTITYSDPAFGEVWTENILIEVLDSPDPITDITPHQVNVHENQVGAFIAQLTAVDEDSDSNATFTIDDDRFVFVHHELWLADGVALDYEAAPQFLVSVTATDGDSFTKQIVINVDDVPEPADSIGLTAQSVMELSPGHSVGDVLINGLAAQDSYDVVVSDPRFEIVGSKLKLIDDQWVDLATQQEIQLTITAQDAGQVFAAISQSFAIEIIENPSPYHNDDSPYDVDHSGIISANDALLIINFLNIYGPGVVGSGDPAFGYDVNGDGFVTALDALLIMNQLNIQNLNGGGTVGGGEKEGPEGEQIQPQRITPPQQQDLILPQHIATNDPLDDSQSNSSQNNPAAIAVGQSTADRQIASIPSQPADDDEFASSVDEALDDLLRNSLLS